MSTSSVLHGIGVSPGFAIGPAFLLGRRKLKIVHQKLERESIASEQERFSLAVTRAEEHIRQLLAEIPQELRDHTAILQSQLLMLRDDMLFRRVIQMIDQRRMNAEWALEHALDHVRDLFSRIKDAYFRERVKDVEYVAQQVLIFLTGQENEGLAQLDHPVILVAHDLSPADTTQLRPDRVLALVTETGSRTSHTAILARALGIPAVVGLEGAQESILSGKIIIVDALAGEVTPGPDGATIIRYEGKRDAYRQYNLVVARNSRQPALTPDGARVRIKANIELLDELADAVGNGAEGIGLFRTEYLYLAERELPTEETLYNVYRQVVERLAPLPVTIRTLDIGGDKFLSTMPLSAELNPALGLRAIRLCLREPALFRTQLRAILRASAHGDVRVLFPLISGRKQVSEIKAHLAAVREELNREAIPFKADTKLGIMIEVPTAVAIADILAREVDFFSIGTNDLIQYALAIDRVNEHVAHLYNPLHTGILRMIKQTVDAGHAAGIEVAICGEMAREAAYLPILLGLGLDEMSMNPNDIPAIKEMIRQSSLADCRRLMADMLRMSNTDEIRRALNTFLLSRFPGLFDPDLGFYKNVVAQG